MKDLWIKAGFVHGVGTAEPPGDLWERVERELAAREEPRTLAVRIRRWVAVGRTTAVAQVASPHARWSQRWLAVAASLLLLAGVLTLGVVPEARAALLERVRTVWQGEVGGLPAAVRQGDPAAEQSLRADGLVGDLPWTEVESVTAAAEQTGLAAPVLALKEARLTRVSLTRTAWGAGELRGIGLEYQVGGERYQVTRMGSFRDGAHRPYQGLETTFFGGMPVEGVSSLKAGQREALCLSTAPGGFCVWLEDGYQVAVIGPDRKVVEGLIAKVGR